MSEHLDHLVPINNVCNQKCNFCSAEYRMQWNTPIPLAEIFADIRAKWNYIQISWWEPLLSPDVFKILYFIRKYKENCFIEFQSNGLLLLKNNNLTKLQKFHINLYNINYPAHIEHINDIIVQSKGTLKIREAAMQEVLARGLKLRVNIIVNTYNYEILPEMIQYIWSRFPNSRIQLSYTKAMWAADKNDEVVARYDKASPYIIEALRLAKDFWIHIDVDHIPLCFLWSYFTNHVDYHKIKSWEKWIFLEEKWYIPKCRWCKLKSYCSWYRKDYLEVYPDEIHTYV